MNVGIIGAGNMARAIVAGLGRPVLVTDGGSGRANEVAALSGGEAVAGNAELAARCDVLFLCHKPAQLAEVAAEIAGYSGTVVSVLAATPVATVKQALPAARVVRIMPNTPVEARDGVIVVSEASDTDDDALERIEALLEALGSIERVPEEQMELATAIGGCAPAFYALFAQRLAEAAAARGMAPEQAARIAGDTLAGTGAVARLRSYDMAAVQREVASPGGLTERALESFDENGLSRLIDRAVGAVLGEASR